MLFQLLMLGFISSLCVFQAIIVEDYFSSVFSIQINLVICVLSQLVIFCYLGDQLLHESAAISSKIYNSMWYEVYFSAPNQRARREFHALIQLSITRRNQAVGISAGGFTTMSRPTFMRVNYSQKLFAVMIANYFHCIFRWWKFVIQLWAFSFRHKNRIDSINCSKERRQHTSNICWIIEHLNILARVNFIR